MPILPSKATLPSATLRPRGLRRGVENGGVPSTTLTIGGMVMRRLVYGYQDNAENPTPMPFVNSTDRWSTIRRGRHHPRARRQELAPTNCHVRGIRICGAVACVVSRLILRASVMALMGLSGREADDLRCTLV